MLRHLVVGIVVSVGLFVMGTPAFALQAGGVEIGDLETGSVVGQSFKELNVDAQLFAVEIGTLKSWYPPTTVIDFKVRPGRPVLLKVTNKSAGERGFQMTDATNAGSPTVLKVEIVLKPGGDQIRRHPHQRPVLCDPGQYVGLSGSSQSEGAWRNAAHDQVEANRFIVS